MSDVAADLPAFLAKVQFFSEVSKTSLNNLCHNLEVETYYKNDSIISKGEVGDAMYAILKGEVKVHEAQHDFGKLSQGECFGEYALIDDETRSASVTALGETKVAKIDREHFQDLMKKDKGFFPGCPLRHDQAPS